MGTSFQTPPTRQDGMICEGEVSNGPRPVVAGVERDIHQGFRCRIQKSHIYPTHGASGRGSALVSTQVHDVFQQLFTFIEDVDAGSGQEAKVCEVTDKASVHLLLVNISLHSEKAEHLLIRQELGTCHLGKTKVVQGKATDLVEAGSLPQRL